MAKKSVKKADTKKTTPQEAENDGRMPLSWGNYKLMLIGLGIIVLGFILMSGGGSDDPAVFNWSMFSFRRITLAPILVLFGFGFEIFAIMKRFPAKK